MKKLKLRLERQTIRVLVTGLGRVVGGKPLDSDASYCIDGCQDSWDCIPVPEAGGPGSGLTAGNLSRNIC